MPLVKVAHLIFQKESVYEVDWLYASTERGRDFRSRDSLLVLDK